jgi:hypothetical protein
MGKEAHVERNEPCPCGSGKKYKHCCLGKPPPEVRRRRGLLAGVVAVAGVGLGIATGILSGPISGIGAGGAVLVVAAVIYIIRDPPPPQPGKGRRPAGLNFGR